jgi:hypothetical protein
MKPDCVRTSVDLPRDLHRRLHEAAARHGTSARQLILKSIEAALEETSPRRARHRLSLEEPIVPSRGKAFDFSNEELYDFIDFP